MTAANKQKVKNRLKELRKNQNWSQADLARALKISRQAVNGFESGKFTPSLEMAFKIALLFDVAIESIFIYQEQTLMQNILEKVENFSQWLPRGERFTEQAIAVIEYAQNKAGLFNKSQVEPADILEGLMADSTSPIAHLLQEFGLSLKLADTELEQITKTTKVKKFSPESKYILELALHAARLRQKKNIGTEHLLWGLIQLMQLGTGNLQIIVQNNELDLDLLVERARQLQ